MLMIDPHWLRISFRHDARQRFWCQLAPRDVGTWPSLPWFRQPLQYSTTESNRYPPPLLCTLSHYCCCSHVCVCVFGVSESRVPRAVSMWETRKKIRNFVPSTRYEYKRLNLCCSVSKTRIIFNSLQVSELEKRQTCACPHIYKHTHTNTEGGSWYSPCQKHTLSLALQPLQHTTSSRVRRWAGWDGEILVSVTISSRQQRNDSWCESLVLLFSFK